jgi:hypothetical protein
LLAATGSWKRCVTVRGFGSPSNSQLSSGESLGVGVRQTIMNELMNKVFSDVTVWKTMGNTKVLSITPPGLQPDAMRLRRLKAYGYACRLYVVTEHALPPALSVLFAYALLAPLGEYAPSTTYHSFGCTRLNRRHC